MREPVVITISGAGSTRTPALIGTLVEMKERFPVSKIIFYDPCMERFNKIRAYVELVLRTHSPRTEIVIAENMDDAYRETDMVFCQMRVGGTDMRGDDEKTPLKFGLVGQETCGAGGFAYGMRSIGPMVELVNCVRKYSDKTWILNYTNPAALVAVGLGMAFPNDDRIINMCDQPYSMMVSFGKILGVDHYKLRAKYFGLNHFGWFTDLYSVDGKNYFEELKTFLIENEFMPYNAGQRAASVLKAYKKVNKILKHFPEYIPNNYLQYYFYHEEIVSESDINYTRADEAKDNREKEVWRVCKLAENSDSMDGIDLLTSPVFAAMMIEVAESIAYDLNNEFVLITKNDGIIDNFSSDAYVEVAGTLGKDGIKPYKFGEISTFYKGLMENQYAFEKLAMEAFFEKSYDKALMALTLNRSINSPEKAKAVLDELLITNKKYWTLER